MFTREGTNQKFDLYRDILAVYKSLIEEALIEAGESKNEVVIKNNNHVNVNRAPLIVIERGEMHHTPRSLMLGEEIVEDGPDRFSSTCHIIEYPIEFTCYGNSYIEAEKLGTIAMEVILTAGMAGVKERHPNIDWAELPFWGKTYLAEGQDSSIFSNMILGKVFIEMQGIYKLTT
jgi:hypothetical protein